MNLSIKTKCLPYFIWLLVPSLFITIVSSWMTMFVGRTRTGGGGGGELFVHRQRSSILYSEFSSNDQSMTIENDDVFVFKASAASGLTDTELSTVLNGIKEIIEFYSDDLFGNNKSNVVKFQFDISSMEKIPILDNENIGVVGALGRVLLLETNLPMISDDDEDDENNLVDVIQYLIAEKMDHFLYNEASLKQPILISIQNFKDSKDGILDQELGSIVQNQVTEFEICSPLTEDNNYPLQEASTVPTVQIEMDGAFVSEEEVWDTSSILVFDDLVSDDLRSRLLDVTLGRSNKDKQWDDIANGPDPSRWVRGGLVDIPDDDDDDDSGGGGGGGGGDNKLSESSSWGLSDEAIEEICFQRHGAIDEFEMILSKLFPQFTVTRLPEAVFGSSVSPLTANAPTSQGMFQYHIDGDPNLTPPSPWTDIYGRYPNRIQGKPRFMSCLLYLNDEWHGDDWGAPTRFLDPPTDEFYEVLPRPGRCVLMDQDLTHTVVAPNLSAGNRPRYSLVWKLILHPKVVDQDMTNLAGNRNWPLPTLFGSAKRKE